MKSETKISTKQPARIFCLLALAVVMAYSCRKEKEANRNGDLDRNRVDSLVVFYLGNKNFPYKLKLILDSTNRQRGYNENDGGLSDTNGCKSCFIDGEQLMAPKTSLVIGLTDTTMNALDSAMRKYTSDCGNLYLITYMAHRPLQRRHIYSSDLGRIFEVIGTAHLISMHNQTFFELVKSDPRSSSFGCM